MTAANVAVAMAVPRMARLELAWMLRAGILATLGGMAWLSRVDAGSAHLTAR